MLDSKQIKYLKSACYYTDTNIGGFEDFFTYLINDLFIDEDIYNIIKRDYEKIQETIKKSNIFNNINSFYSDDGYKKNYQIILDEAQILFGVKLDIPIFLVDRLIEPFNSRDCDAISIDEKDSKKLGLPYGVYYIKKYLTHVYFEFIIAHELVHQFISYYSKYVPFTSLMEEGFCDLFSIIILYKSKLFDITTIKNILLYNRYFSRDIIWQYYLKSFKFACQYLSKTGLKNTVELLKSGRENIKNLTINDIKRFDLYESDDDIQELLLNMDKLDFYYLVDVIDYYVIQQIISGDYDNIKNKYKNNIYDLNENGLICIDDKDNIYVQDSGFYQFMRYVINDR